jgi:hypothetical protein
MNCADDSQPRRRQDKSYTHEVQATVVWHEGSDLLSVFDELDTDTLSDSGVGLFGLDADLNVSMLSQYNVLGK